MMVSHAMIFLYVPNEKVMGAVQRIFYFHVGSVMACYGSVLCMFIGAIGFLTTDRKIFDRINRAAGEVGFLFASCVMATGMIWGHAAWGEWFSFEPRLVSFLIVWLMLLGFSLLVKFGNTERLSVHAAILGILVSVSIPLSIYSVELWPHFAQVHPQVVEKRGLTVASMRYTLYVSMLTMLVFGGFLICLRSRILKLEEQIKANTPLL